MGCIQSDHCYFFKGSNFSLSNYCAIQICRLWVHCWRWFHLKLDAKISELTLWDTWIWRFELKSSTKGAWRSKQSFQLRFIVDKYMYSKDRWLECCNSELGLLLPLHIRGFLWLNHFEKKISINKVDLLKKKFNGLNMLFTI